MSEDMVNEPEEEENNKAPIVIGLVVLFLLIVSALAYFTVTSISPPENLQAIVEGNNVVLIWDASKTADVVGYNVYRSTVEGELGEKINSKPVQDTTYIDKSLKEGTYYYIVRATTADEREDDNLNQVKAVVGAAPYGLSMVLGDGEGHSNTNNVRALIKAENAKQCQFLVDGKAQEWFDYVEETTVYVNDGKHVVSLHCRNDGGLSEEISQEILVDTTTPFVSMNVLGISSSKLHVILNIEDEDKVDCVAVAGTKVVDSFSALPGELDKTFDLPEGSYIFVVSCKDEAGNEGNATLPINNTNETEQEQINFDFHVSINNGAEKTSSRSVLLQVTGENIEACRYTNENFYPEFKTDWEEYKKVREWTLSPGKGEKTVYVQCIGANDEIKERSASILYTSSSGGGGEKNNTNNNQTNSSNSSAYIYSVNYYYEKNGQVYTINNGDEIPVSTVSAIVKVENAEICYLVDEYKGNDYLIAEGTPTSIELTLSGELKGEGENYLYVTCYDSSGNAVSSGRIIVSYILSQPTPAVAKSVKIIGYVKRGDFYEEDEEVTAVSTVKLLLSSENAEFGKQWNTPYEVDAIPIDVPGVVDSEEEAEWNEHVNGYMDFRLIPKTVVNFNGVKVFVKDGIREVNFKVKNSNGESEVVKDTIFYDATPPVLNSIDADSLVLQDSRTGGVPVGAVKLEISAYDNGDEYNLGLYRMLIKRYKCSDYDLSPAIRCNNCKLEKQVVVPYSVNYLDYPLTTGTYKYEVRVWDRAGYISGAKTAYVYVSVSNNTNNTNATNTSLKNVSVYYVKDGEEYVLEDHMAINTRELVAYVYSDSASHCKFIDVFGSSSVVLAESDYSETPTVLSGSIPDIEGEHTVFVSCDGVNSDSVSFYYDPVPPRVSAYSRPYLSVDPKNKTLTYKIKLRVKARDNHNLARLDINYTIIEVNLTCLKDHNYSVNERPFFVRPFRFRRIFDCISLHDNIPFVSKNISGKVYKETFKLSENINLSSTTFRYFYVFKVYVEDEATNSAFTYSNPVFAHRVCFKNYNDDRFNFCYLPDKYDELIQYLENMHSSCYN